MAAHEAIDVADARQDARFRDDPAVREPDVIAYLGAPVRDAGGNPIGTLCAVSDTSRPWTAEERETIETLAEAVSRKIRMRAALAEQKALNAELRRAERRFSDLAANVPGAIFRHVLYPDGRDTVDCMSPGCVEIWEVGPEEIEKDAARLWEIIVPEDVAGMQASIARSAQSMEKWQHRWRIVGPSDNRKWLQGYATPQALDDGAILWNALILDVIVEVDAQGKAPEDRTVHRRGADAGNHRPARPRSGP